MKINEVAQLTGLTKKAIHFYIKEELLHPQSNAENGYYEFSSQDIQTLQNISLLRQLGMPVVEVRKMLNNPQMSCYFLHNLLETLRPELHDMMQKVQKLIYLLDTLPPKTDVDFLRTNSLAGRLNFEDQIERLYNLYFHDENATMLSILIWGSFLNVDSTEYRSYLWKRLVAMARSEMDTSLRYVYRYFMALDWKDIDEEASRRYYGTMKIARLTPDALEPLCKELLLSLRAVLRNRELLERYKLVYRPILLPMMNFCHSASGFIGEYNPLYTPCIKNMDDVSALLLKDLEGPESGLFKILRQELPDTLDLTLRDSFLFFTLCTFAQSAFSILPEAQVKQLLTDL